MNATNKHINVTAEDKKAHKEMKALEKQKRKEKSLQKPDNKKTDSEIPVSNLISNKMVDNVVKICKEQKKSTIKEKPKHKTDIDTKGNLVESLEISKTIDHDRKQKVQRVNSSDRVSFSDSNLKPSSSLLDEKSSDPKQVSYFKHLNCPNRQKSFENSQIPDSKIHPAIKKLGCDLDSFKIRGSTKRCQKFFDALKQLIRDLPVKNNEYFSKTFSIAFDNSIEFLAKRRPLAVTMQTAIDYLKINISVLREENDPDKCRKDIIETIDQFRTERIDVAHKGIQNLVSNYIRNDSRILVYSYSKIVFKSILHAWNKMKSEKSGSFQVFVVDVFPDFAGEKMMSKLKTHEILCCRTNLSSIPQIMPQISLVLFGAHSVMPNNNVISASGSASVANTAKACSKPVIICAETYKFNVQNHFDGIGFNEIGNPDFLVGKMTEIYRKTENNSCETMKNWRDLHSNISVLDLLYDVIPGYLINGIICELGFISSSAASYVSRIKQPYY